MGQGDIIAERSKRYSREKENNAEVKINNVNLWNSPHLMSSNTVVSRTPQIILREFKP